MKPILINLIPYREQAKAQQSKILASVIVGIILASCVVYYGVYSVFSQRASQEHAKVVYLQSTVHTLDGKIKSIVDLRKKRTELITREKLITTLQNRRDMVVNLFNALSLETPKGIFLSSLKQTGATVNIQGYAEDNEVIAEFMRRIKKSTVFAHPQLYIISTTKHGSENVKQFTLTMAIHGVGHSKTGSKA